MHAHFIDDVTKAGSGYMTSNNLSTAQGEKLFLFTSEIDLYLLF